MARFAILVLLVLAVAGTARAQRAAPAADTLVAADYDALTFVSRLPSAEAARSAATATFELDLVGFPLEAEAAFAFAAGIWATHIESAIPIHVQARYEALAPRTLAAAGPNCVFRAGRNAPLPIDQTWYPVALAEALVGDELNPPGSGDCAGVDITATFNSGIDWYFGTDGNTPAGQYDFATVVLHELGHGLGFLGSFEVVTEEEGGCPAYLGDVAIGQGCWGIGFTDSSIPPLPLVFDRFAEDDFGSGIPLLDTSVYPNPSFQLGAVLQSDAVFFDGPAVAAVTDAVPIDLYAPSNFEPGSSFSHLNEVRCLERAPTGECVVGCITGNEGQCVRDALDLSLAPGESNSLMTPQLARSEAIFSPGSFTCAIFRDIGWPLGEDCRALVEGQLASFIARADGRDVVLTFRLGVDTEFVTAVVEREVDEDFLPVEIAPVPLDPEETVNYIVRVEDLADGTYTYRLRLVREDGTVFTSAPRTVVVFDPPLTVYPNPFATEATVRVAVAETQDVSVAVFDVLGQRVVLLADAEEVRRGAGGVWRLDGRGLAAGVYFVRVVGKTFEATQTVTHIR